jgi:CBS domain-containing protein
MNDFTTFEASSRLVLLAENAAGLMSERPVSVNSHSCLREALAFLVEKGFSAAPVIDGAGRLVGVLSRSDLLAHDLETFEHVAEAPEFYDDRQLKGPNDERLGPGFQVEKVDGTRVCDVMTPAVFCVLPDDSAAKVIHDLVSRKVHRLFVVDEHNVLVGVITTMDVLRRLQPLLVRLLAEEAEEEESHGCFHQGR